MSDNLSRRDALKTLGAVGTVGGLGALRGVLRSAEMVVAGRPVEVAVFGEAGRHARTTIGVPALPADAAVEVEGMFEIG